MSYELEARRVDYVGKKSLSLSNGWVRAVIDCLGGMMPEFSLRRGKGGINAHWIPGFHDNSGQAWSQPRHEGYWKEKLLYLLAGDFLCSPNFGPHCMVDGIELPAHGWTANEEWSLDACGVDARRGVAYADFSLTSPAPGMPLHWKKRDLVLEGQCAYYSVMDIENQGDRPISINVTRHNTLGSPFLETGCRISLSARRFLTAPSGTEFDDTGRLVQGAEFDDLGSAPLRGGGTVDLRDVPGMIGATDFVVGAIPVTAALGWSCVVNPRQRVAYLCFFPGPAAAPSDEIALSFNDLWMQYGGRDFTPWALHDGAADRSFCLGTENAIGAFASGLEFARSVPELLGRPTIVEVPARTTRRLCYGVALLDLAADLAAEGLSSIEAEGSEILIAGGNVVGRFPLETDFARIRELATARFE
jgi:hypothetical protein